MISMHFDRLKKASKKGGDRPEHLTQGGSVRMIFGGRLGS